MTLAMGVNVIPGAPGRLSKVPQALVMELNVRMGCVFPVLAMYPTIPRPLIRCGRGRPAHACVGGGVGETQCPKPKRDKQSVAKITTNV